MMKFTQSEIEELLPSYLSGDMPDKERAMIEDWRQESPENESIYQESCRAWEVIPLLKEMEKFNSFEALTKVNKRLIKAENSNWRTIIQHIAAILLLPVLVYSGYQTIRNFSLKNQQKESVVMQTVSSRPGMVSEFSLPDGTKVWLNSGSELQFPMPFQSGLREVNLKGEAFFEVAKKIKQPFRVNTRELNIDVSGTSFNVISYEGEVKSEVILIEGQVTLSAEVEKITKEFGELEPGQHAIYTAESQTISINKVDPEKYIAWLDGNLVFQDDPMQDVVKRLGRWFNVEIVIEDPAINEYIYKATFRNENLKQVLDLLKLSAPIDYRIVESIVLPGGEFTKRKVYLMNKKK